MAAKLRLIMLIIIDNMYIENSFVLNSDAHEIRTHIRNYSPLFYRV
jgi:hypothetical protein